MTTSRFKSWGASAALLFSLGTAAAKAQDEPKPAPPLTQEPVQPLRDAEKKPRSLTLAMIPLEYLKAELKLTDEQAAKVETIQTQAKTDLMKLAEDPAAPKPPRDPDSPLLPAAAPPSDPAKTQEIIAKMNDLRTKADSDIEAVLNEDQKKQLPEFFAETGGMVEAGIPAALLAELKLTPEQRRKIVDAGTDAQRKWKEMPREERKAKRKAWRKDLSDRIQEVLTDDQKQTLKKFAEEPPKKDKTAP